jgi:hypothetical protein
MWQLEQWLAVKPGDGDAVANLLNRGHVNTCRVVWRRLFEQGRA